MKKLWFFSKLLLLVSLGFATIIATSPPPPPRFVIITANNNFFNDYSAEETVFACLNEKVRLEWSIPDTTSVTLTATPFGNLNPDLNKQQGESYGFLETTALGDVTVALESGSLKFEAILNLLSEDICTGFPINLIANLEGTFKQTVPEAVFLSRRLELRWRGNALQAKLIRKEANQEGGVSESLTNCQLFPSEDKLICLAGDEANPRLRLEGVVTAAGFTGSYKGFDESTGSSISFGGTFDFNKAQQ